jgi:hypothetical protein
MCRVETSVGAWNTGGRFFSDVTLAYGTGTFSLIVFQRIGIVRMIPLFTPPGRAARSSVPMQITFEIRKLERQCQSKSLILPGGRLESV